MRGYYDFAFAKDNIGESFRAKNFFTSLSVAQIKKNGKMYL